MRQVEISQISGASPFDIYICEPSLSFCVLVGTYNSAIDPPLPIRYDVPDFFDGYETIIIKIIDAENCETFQLLVCISVTPTNTPTNTPTLTQTPTNTPSNSVTPTNTPSNTQTSSVTPTNTPTNSVTPTNTATQTQTPTNTPTETTTPTTTPTNTVTPSPTKTQTNTPTETPTNTPTNTNTPSTSVVCDVFVDVTPLFVTPTPTPTTTPPCSGILDVTSIFATATPTPSVTPTNTATPTTSVICNVDVEVTPIDYTPTPTPSVTGTPPCEIDSDIIGILGTSTPTPSVTTTQTKTPTNTPTVTKTGTPTRTPDPTPLVTKTQTVTPTQSSTIPVTPSQTVTNTQTTTPTPAVLPASCELSVRLKSGVIGKLDFLTSTWTTTSWITPAVGQFGFTMTDLYFWNSRLDSGTLTWFIDEWDISVVSPTLIRSITCPANIIPRSIFSVGVVNQLYITNVFTTPNSIQIIDISGPTASVVSTVFSVPPSQEFPPTASFGLYVDINNNKFYFSLRPIGGTVFDVYFGCFDGSGNLLISGPAGSLIYGSFIYNGQVYVNDANAIYTADPDPFSPTTYNYNFTQSFPSPETIVSSHIGQWYSSGCTGTIPFPSPTPTSTTTKTPTQTLTPTNTITPTRTPAVTPLSTKTPTPTNTNTKTPTPTPTETVIPEYCGDSGVGLPYPAMGITTVGGINYINGSVNINGVIVNASYSGTVTQFDSITFPGLTSCVYSTWPIVFSGYIDVWLGAGSPGNYPFTYTMTFSQPVNNVILTFQGSGQQFNPASENFIITTDTGLPTINVLYACDYIINSNEIILGPYTQINQSAGGRFIINNAISYTAITVSGQGGVAGSLMRACVNYPSVTPTPTPTSNRPPQFLDNCDVLIVTTNTNIWYYDYSVNTVDNLNDYVIGTQPSGSLLDVAVSLNQFYVQNNNNQIFVYNYNNIVFSATYVQTINVGGQTLEPGLDRVGGFLVSARGSNIVTISLVNGQVSNLFAKPANRDLAGSIIYNTNGKFICLYIDTSTNDYYVTQHDNVGLLEVDVKIYDSIAMTGITNPTCMFVHNNDLYVGTSNGQTYQMSPNDPFGNTVTNLCPIQLRGGKKDFNCNTFEFDYNP